MIRDVTRRMALEKIAPRAAEIDETDEFPWDIVELYKQNGTLKLVLPDEYGGVGADTTTLCLVMEEIARVSASCSCIVFSTEALIHILVRAATSEQKDRFFPRLSQGDKISAFVLTEPEAGSDANAMRTNAVLEGDYYILNGRKCFISNAIVSDFYLVFARVKTLDNKKGISAFVVEKDTQGLSMGKKENKMGLRGNTMADLIFENARVPKENIVGGEGEGWKILAQVANQMRLYGASAMGLGIAQGALDYAVEYAKQRYQFGKPIASLQAIQFMLADMHIQTEAVRSILYRTSQMIDRGEGSAAEIGSLVSMSKCLSGDTAIKVATDAVQVLGGYGYIKDYPVERMMRDAKSVQIFDGTNQIQRLVVARNMLGIK
ncbi:MAG: acyl-CoA dehydrogenase [Deltaproteobacteria bacterium]|nr:MAG: acyl-CoA dehydrogenase [Deltaproteobacteria bacterium]